MTSFHFPVSRYSIANSFRRELETVLTNSLEFVKTDCNRAAGEIKKSFNKSGGMAAEELPDNTINSGGSQDE